MRFKALSTEFWSLRRFNELAGSRETALRYSKCNGIKSLFPNKRTFKLLPS